eukprot:355628_1
MAPSPSITANASLTKQTSNTPNHNSNPQKSSIWKPVHESALATEENIQRFPALHIPNSQPIPDDAPPSPSRKSSRHSRSPRKRSRSRSRSRSPSHHHRHRKRRDRDRDRHSHRDRDRGRGNGRDRG